MMVLAGPGEAVRYSSTEIGTAPPYMSIMKNEDMFSLAIQYGLKLCAELHAFICGWREIRYCKAFVERGPSGTCVSFPATVKRAQGGSSAVVLQPIAFSENVNVM